MSTYYALMLIHYSINQRVETEIFYAESEEALNAKLTKVKNNPNVSSIEIYRPEVSMIRVLEWDIKTL